MIRDARRREFQVVSPGVSGVRLQRFSGGRITKPIDVVLEGKVVERLVPPGELSDAENEQVLREGWELVQQAQARNEGVSEREIAKVVNGAAKRVRAQSK